MLAPAFAPGPPWPEGSFKVSKPAQGPAATPFDESVDIVAALAYSALGGAINSSSTASPGADQRGLTRLIEALQAAGLSAESICLDLIEPAARRLGECWSADDCSDVDLTLALGRLQALVRHLGAQFAQPATPGPPSGVLAHHSVLLAPQPGEPHMLGLVLASEFYLQADWGVACDFPSSADALCGVLKQSRVDVLHLSLSGVFRRDHRLLAMTETIRAARLASLHPGLIVLVSGMVFVDRPEWSVLVGADAACTRLGQLVPLSDKLIRARTASALARAQKDILEVGCQVALKFKSREVVIGLDRGYEQRNRAPY